MQLVTLVNHSSYEAHFALMQPRSVINAPTPKRALLAGLGAALIVIAISQVIAYGSDKSQALQRKDLALVNASELRSILESRANNLLSAARGIVAYVELHGDIGQPEFERLAASLVGDNPLVVNLALLEGSTVHRVYPWENNKAIVGYDVLTQPFQIPTFNRMAISGQPVLIGPLKVQQGNLAFIGRVPIYRNRIITTKLNYR